MKEFAYGEVSNYLPDPIPGSLTKIGPNEYGTIISTNRPLAQAAADTKKEGLKFDNQKPDLSLLPIEFLTEVANAMMHGEKKYGRYNFTNGMSWHRIIAASLRHIYAFASGEDLDPESGVSHLGHAGACILMLTVYFKRGLGEDTREKKKK